MRTDHICPGLLGIFVGTLLLAGCGAGPGSTADITPTGNPVSSPFPSQNYQPPQNCLPCHQRQYDELRSSVKSGYRNVSPLFNALEVAGNLVNGGLLRPVYSDSTVLIQPGAIPLNTNMFTSPVLTQTRQLQAGFCFGCHNPHIMRMGNDPTKREVPALAGLQANFLPDVFRPLRDFQLIDSSGNQVIPAEIGGDPPPGSGPSLGAAGITCDMCHNTGGPDVNRSLQQDGFADMGMLLNESVEKVGPFTHPVAVKGDFHVSSNDTQKINYLRSPNFCAACHDVRVPNANLTAEEHNINPGGQNVKYYRLENLSTEWQTGPYNSTNNPFGKVIRCQDCHMSLYPYAGSTSYQVGDLSITSPTPAIFATDYAAVPGVSTDGNAPLPQRPVVNHYFSGIDVPLLPLQQLRDRLGSDYSDPNATGVDSHGIPNGLATRRVDLLKAAVRINLDKTDATAMLAQPLNVRMEAVALTGHRFPSGFSQERDAYVALTVTDDNGFLLYQSGYLVDKPHPQTGEMAPDGNLDDEDKEHLIAVVNPGSHIVPYATGTGNNGQLNLVYETGPDSGPDARIFAGAPEGLVVFRNEITRIFLPGDSLGRTDAGGNPIIVTKPHFEETFSAALANSVDNYRSLAPLRPTMYDYEIQLPTASELAELGVTLKSPLHIHADVNFRHFPPVFMRFLAATTGANGPTGHDLHLVNEALIDSLLRVNRAVASADFTVDLEP